MAESDEALVQRFIAEGDRAAFVSLVRRHLDRVRRILFGILNGNLDDIEDVEQEVLAALYRDLGKFEERSSFTTYLYRFTRNRAIDYLRKRQRQKRLVQIARLHYEEPSIDPEREMLDRDDCERLRSALGRLREAERTMMVLKEIEGLSVAEGAQVMGLAEGTVKSRLHRTRRKIAGLMGDDEA